MHTYSYFIFFYFNRRKMADLYCSIASYSRCEIFFPFNFALITSQILYISIVTLSILIITNNELLTLNKVKTPSHELTYYIDIWLLLNILATSRQSESVLPPNSPYLLKWSTDLKWMLIGNISMADMVEISCEKKYVFKSTICHVSGTMPNTTETFGMMS